MDKDRILLAHGGGGTLSNDLISKVIVPALGTPPSSFEDASPVEGEEGLRFTTDSFVVKPLFFPGGDIGSLAVHGTVNDLAVSGARPLSVSLALIIEEGMEVATLKRLMESAGSAAEESGVAISTGDTKVVARGEADGIFITTSGVGRAVKEVGSSRIAEGDAVIINGPIADHGIAVMSAREGIGFDTPVQSDSQPVWPIVRALLDAGLDIHAMRDPTRGGVAATCNELASSSRVSIVLDETALPVRAAVAGACEMLGLDPLTVANEGKVLVFVPQDQAERVVDVMQRHPRGAGASVIGAAAARREKPVYVTTRHGGERIVEMPYGEELPRIC
jgi:hydrogenase expression/formation protein HypE